MPSDATIGSGPDAVVLKVSQDAFRGDARYTVSIDGVPVDGTLTAGALRSLGEQDTVAVLGNFAPGQHTVAVDFLNDAWGGTPETDRNLYVEGASFEGQILLDSTVALLTAGPRTVGTFLEATSTGRGFGWYCQVGGLWPERHGWAKLAGCRPTSSPTPATASRPRSSVTRSGSITCSA